jgi:uncharacterized protein
MMAPYNLLDLALVTLAAVAMPVQSLLSQRTLARTPRAELNLVRRYWFIIARGVLISLLILFDWWWMGRPWTTLGLDFPIGFRGRLGFGFDAVLTCYYTYALLLQKLSAERLVFVRQRLANARIMPQTRAEMAIFPLVVILASPFEELLFRAFLIWFIAPFAGLWGAVLLSSTIFGLGHAYQGWFGILRTAFIGLAFATGYALTHSLWWLILAHVMVNLFGDLFARRLARLSPATAQ